MVLYRIEGGGHTWPGAPTDDGGGLTTRQIQADWLVLDFFAQHPLLQPSTLTGPGAVSVPGSPPPVGQGRRRPRTSGWTLSTR